MDADVLNDLTKVSERSRDLQRESRRVLVAAVRRAAAAGFSQREIARAVGRSQPEVSRLLRFQPSSIRGHKVTARRREIIEMAQAAGFGNVRVMGSVARGDDGPSSDVDLLVTAPADITLFGIARLEASLSALLGEQVEVVPDSHLRPHLSTRVLGEAAVL